MADLFVLRGALHSSPAHMAMTASTLGGHSCGSSEPIPKRLPAISHHAEILGAYNLGFGYDADNCLDQETEREKR